MREKWKRLVPDLDILARAINMLFVLGIFKDRFVMFVLIIVVLFYFGLYAANVCTLEFGQ